MARTKHGLKGKPSNNPNGKPKQDIKKEQVGIYVESETILKLGGKSEIRQHFNQVIEKLLKK